MIIPYHIERRNYTPRKNNILQYSAIRFSLAFGLHIATLKAKKKSGMFQEPHKISKPFVLRNHDERFQGQSFKEIHHCSVPADFRMTGLFSDTSLAS